MRPAEKGWYASSNIRLANVDVSQERDGLEPGDPRGNGIDPTP